MITRSIISIALCTALAAGCTRDRDGDEPDADAETDGEIDVPTDEPAEDVPEEEAPPACPPECASAPPDHDTIGMPCLSELDCGTSYRCLTASTEVYESETYDSWVDGACVLWGEDTAACDPEDPATCPDGTVCVYFGESSGTEYYGCVDGCSFTDSAWNPLDWNCGCRARYECHINIEACLPGCSNDRECCEVWDDLDDDSIRESGEVMLDSDCTNWCDGDDEDEFPADDCMASFSCINEGDASADYHCTCLFDSDCPPDGRCLNEVHYTDEDTGEPYYPGGLCLKDRCNLAGRGCGTDLAGECVNLGTADDPFYACIASCVTGYGPEDGDSNPCRHPTDGHPYTCSPYPTTRWMTPGTNDGLCFPAMVPGTDPATLYSACSADEQCTSPKGLGSCLDLMDKPGFCSAFCNQNLAESVRICGAAASAGAVVPGVCALDICLPACDTPSGTIGSNGCPTLAGLPSFACYPNDGSYGGASYHDTDGTASTGFCLPACTTTADCALLWSGPVTCNTTTGVCE